MSTEATLLDALRAVPGVAAADIEPDERPDGAGTLRLQLAPGADEIAVATSVNRVLREQFGLAVDAGRVQVVEESVPVVPATEPSVPSASPASPPAAAPAAPPAPRRPSPRAAGSERGATDRSPPSPSYSDAAPEPPGQLATAERGRRAHPAAGRVDPPAAHPDPADAAGVGRAGRDHLGVAQLARRGSYRG